MKRREFCRQITIIGGTVIITPLLHACRTVTPPAELVSPLSSIKPTQPSAPPATLTPTISPTITAVPPSPSPTTEPQSSATPQPTTETDVATNVATNVAYIALVKTADRAVGVQRAIDLLALNPARSLPVLLKPNFNSADPAPASTHPEIVRSLALALQGMGARSITIGERSGMGSTRQVMQQIGVFDLADELGLKTAVFDEIDEKEWVVRRANDFHWPDGFAVPRLLLDSPCVVQTCNLKTHRFGGHFTLSLKNSVGFAAKRVSSDGINYMEQLHSSDYQRHMIAEINTVYEPSLIVVDGVNAFVSGGPDAGQLVHPEVILAGTDRIAVDAVGVAILRLFGTTPEVSQGAIFAQEQIARAVELGLGIDSPTKIRFITGDVESQAYAETIAAVLQ